MNGPESTMDISCLRNVRFHRNTYECVDRSMESIPGSQNHADNGHFHHVEMGWPVLPTTTTKNSTMWSVANSIKFLPTGVK